MSCPSVQDVGGIKIKPCYSSRVTASNIPTVGNREELRLKRTYYGELLVLTGGAYMGEPAGICASFQSLIWLRVECTGSERKSMSLLSSAIIAE
jgi:hypothetical protein